MKDFIPDAEIGQKESTFSVKKKNFDLENTKQVMKLIQNTAGELAGRYTNIEINSTQKTSFFFKNIFTGSI